MQAVIRQSKRERRMDDYHVNELQIKRTEYEYPCLPAIARFRFYGLRVCSCLTY